MSNIDILKKYPKQEKRLTKLFNWLDRNEISLNELAKEDLELYFKTVKNAKNTGEMLKSCLKQVLIDEGLQGEWVQTVIVPYPTLFLSLSDALKTVDDYARAKGYERYKVEPDGFNSVKAALILLWIGVPTQETGYVLKTDVGENSIKYKGNEYLYIDDISDFMIRYKKSTGYFAGTKPRLKFQQYKEDEYFLRTTRTASRDKIIKRLFERLSDLDIDVNSIQKAGLFQRAFDDEQQGRSPNISLPLLSEYNQYKKKKSALV